MKDLSCKKEKEQRVLFCYRKQIDENQKNERWRTLCKSETHMNEEGTEVHLRLS